MRSVYIGTGVARTHKKARNIAFRLTGGLAALILCMAAADGSWLELEPRS